MNSLAPSHSSTYPAAMSQFDELADARCILDLVHLSRQTLGDRALETELLELFDKQAASALTRLSCGAVRDPQIHADIAHMLKGSARGVGAFDVAIAADTLEKALRSGARSADALAGLDHAVGEARRTVAALLEG